MLTVGAWVVFGILVFNFLMTVANLWWLSRSRKTPSPDFWPSLSVLIPARNEQGNIVRLLESLIAQDYPNFEIIVLDDQSEDETLALLKEMAATHCGLKVIQGETLPRDWVGKPFACHQLQLQAQGDYLLFLDADEWVEPDFFKKIISTAVLRKTDLLTGLPRQQIDNFWAALGLPFLYTASLGFFPFFLFENSKFKIGFAVGACLLFTREAYDQLGGHEAMKGQIVEDVAFGRKAKNVGMRLAFLNLNQSLSVRMYGNFSGIWEGFSKNLVPAHGGVLPMLLALGGWIVLWLGPWWILGEAMMTGRQTLIFQTASVAILSLLSPMLSACYFRMNKGIALLYPLTVFFWVIMGLNSARQALSQRGHVWKGRYYP